MDTQEEKDFNSGHRNRVYQKFEKSGFLGWHDYEILEMALFYTVPMKDTKKLQKIYLKDLGVYTKFLMLIRKI